MRRVASLALLMLSAAVLGCTRPPRPAILGQAEAVSKTRVIQHSKTRVPQIFAHAQQLREEAEDAYDANQLELAEEIGARALAAFQRAEAQTRLIAAQQRLISAQHELAEVRERLAELSHKQRLASSQVEALELRLKVVRDAETPAEIQPTSPKREAARRTAALSLLSEARLLCVAARLLNNGSDAAAKALDNVEAAEKTISSNSGSAPIGDATRVRAECLSALTDSRRHAPNASPAADPADQLLSRLDGAMPHSAPTRDDRGVVVAFSDFFDGEQLSSTGRAQLKEMVGIAAANPQLPLLVVHHTTRRSAKIAPAQAQAVKAALREAGADRTPVYSVDDRLPLAVLPVKGSKLRDERVEFVFVSR